MVTANQVDGDVSLIESAHLFVKKQASAVVRPVAIVEVASDEYEVDISIKRECY